MEHQANVEEVSGEMEGEGGGGIWQGRGKGCKEGAVVTKKGNLLTRIRQFILSYYN